MGRLRGSQGGGERRKGRARRRGEGGQGRRWLVVGRKEAVRRLICGAVVVRVMVIVVPVTLCDC